MNVIRESIRATVAAGDAVAKSTQPIPLFESIHAHINLTLDEVKQVLQKATGQERFDLVRLIKQVHGMIPADPPKSEPPLGQSLRLPKSEPKIKKKAKGETLSEQECNEYLLCKRDYDIKQLSVKTLFMLWELIKHLPINPDRRHVPGTTRRGQIEVFILQFREAPRL